MSQPLDNLGEGKQTTNYAQVWSIHSINKLVKNYLLERHAGFRELMDLKEKVGVEINKAIW